MTISSPLHPGPSRPHSEPGTPISGLRVVEALVLMLVGVAVMLGGGVAAALGSALAGDDGLVNSSSTEWTSPGYAVRAEASVEVIAGEVNLPGSALGTSRATADAETDNGVFIGVARTSDVDRYLRGVAHSTVEVPLITEGGSPAAAFVDGGSPRVAPTEAAFWIASSSGPGEQAVTWEPRDTDLTLVVMNGEGTTPVAADVSVSAELRDLALWGLIGLGLGLAVLAIGTGLAGSHRRTRAAHRS